MCLERIIYKAADIFGTKDLYRKGGMKMIQPREEKILQTIQKSKEALYNSEKIQPLNWWEFLYGQMGYTKKIWWLLQFALLVVLWWILYTSKSSLYVQRSMGILAPVFGVLILPELWKNRRSGSVEIEGAAYYSLRQIYAARLLLFAMADILLISGFLTVSVLAAEITVWELAIHFLLPFNVTCGICFGTLCGGRWSSEYFSACLCLIWCFVWVRIVLWQGLYEQISPIVWAGCIALSVVYLCWSVYRMLKNCDVYWEADTAWN